MLRLYVENIETIKSRETHKALRIKKDFGQCPSSYFLFPWSRARIRYPLLME
jgi:hypothetical protein